MRFADLAEADAFLAAHPDVQRIELFIIDPCGVPRGKLLHRDELRAIYTDGRPLPSSILGLTIRGEDVDATGLVWDVADADCWAFPLPGSLQLQTWRRPATAQVQVSMHRRAACRRRWPTRATCWRAPSSGCRPRATTR